MAFSTRRVERDISPQYLPAPHSIDPLPDSLRLGMIAPGITSILSASSTLSLIVFILWRLYSWRKHYKTFIGYNQYVMLVLNLLLADLQQASAFLITWYWFNQRNILAPTTACFAQGWLLHSGDVSSAFFVMAIAIHTFLTAVTGWCISNVAFYGSIIFIWVLSYSLTFAGVLLHPTDYFVRAGAWCWVSSDYEHERLFLHYFWIFLVEFSTIVLYAIIFISLRKRTQRLFNNHGQDPPALNNMTIKAVNRITRLMTLYPLAYIICTLPISCGRMWSMANKDKSLSDAYFLTAGTLLASCGWVDVLVYTLTRKRLLEDTMPSRSLAGSSTVDGGTTGRTITVRELGKEIGQFQIQSAQPLAETQHLDVTTPVSRAGSNDPILSGQSPRISWHSADKQYLMQKMLAEDREPECMEMASLKDGRLEAVPRKAG